MNESCVHGPRCRACRVEGVTAPAPVPRPAPSPPRVAPGGRRAVLMELAVDAAIRTCGGWPVPAADPFAVLQRAFALGVTDAHYDEALEALQARLVIRGFPRYIPPLRWTAP